MTVTFELTAHDFGYVDGDPSTMADPGMSGLWIAPSAQAGRPASFLLV